MNWDAYEEELNEGKRNVKWGVGIGAASAASMALIGATCPLCFVVAPAFVGVGMWKKRKAKQKMSQSDETVESEDSTASS
ncbi:hypothetical protein DN745_08545 [Bradymonas sediminis]|uniref:Uncharacterized protein n=1 Tax=Bradymonas sediminis TaxID=1548548 RepID=A0A2Z4FK85_9DELT|nr:hypothetical protein DN745_08545 [Bradymonas sediminis]